MENTSNQEISLCISSATVPTSPSVMLDNVVGVTPYSTITPPTTPENIRVLHRRNRVGRRGQNQLRPKRLNFGGKLDEPSSSRSTRRKKTLEAETALEIIRFSQTIINFLVQQRQGLTRQDRNKLMHSINGNIDAQDHGVIDPENTDVVLDSVGSVIEELIPGLGSITAHGTKGADQEKLDRESKLAGHIPGGAPLLVDPNELKVALQPGDSRNIWGLSNALKTLQDMQIPVISDAAWLTRDILEDLKESISQFILGSNAMSLSGGIHVWDTLTPEFKNTLADKIGVAPTTITTLLHSLDPADKNALDNIKTKLLHFGEAALLSGQNLGNRVAYEMGKNMLNGVVNYKQHSNQEWWNSLSPIEKDKALVDWLTEHRDYITHQGTIKFNDLPTYMRDFGRERIHQTAEAINIRLTAKKEPEHILPNNTKQTFSATPKFSTPFLQPEKDILRSMVLNKDLEQLNKDVEDTARSISTGKDSRNVKRDRSKMKIVARLGTMGINYPYSKDDMSKLTNMVRDTEAAAHNSDMHALNGNMSAHPATDVVSEVLKTITSGVAETFNNADTIDVQHKDSPQSSIAINTSLAVKRSYNSLNATVNTADTELSSEDINIPKDVLALLYRFAQFLDPKARPKLMVANAYNHALEEWAAKTAQISFSQNMKPHTACCDVSTDIFATSHQGYTTGLLASENVNYNYYRVSTTGSISMTANLAPAMANLAASLGTGDLLTASSMLRLNGQIASGNQMASILNADLKSKVSASIMGGTAIVLLRLYLYLLQVNLFPGNEIDIPNSRIVIDNPIVFTKVATVNTPQNRQRFPLSTKTPAASISYGVISMSQFAEIITQQAVWGNTFTEAEWGLANWGTTVALVPFGLSMMGKTDHAVNIWSAGHLDYPYNQWAINAHLKNDDKVAPTSPASLGTTKAIQSIYANTHVRGPTDKIIFVTTDNYTSGIFPIQIGSFGNSVTNNVLVGTTVGTLNVGATFDTYSNYLSGIIIALSWWENYYGTVSDYKTAMAVLSDICITRFPWYMGTYNDELFRPGFIYNGDTSDAGFPEPGWINDLDDLQKPTNISNSSNAEMVALRGTGVCSGTAPMSICLHSWNMIPNTEGYMRIPDMDPQIAISLAAGLIIPSEKLKVNAIPKTPILVAEIVRSLNEVACALGDAVIQNLGMPVDYLLNTASQNVDTAIASNLGQITFWKSYSVAMQMYLQSIGAVGVQFNNPIPGPTGQYAWMWTGPYNEGTGMPWCRRSAILSSVFDEDPCVAESSLMAATGVTEWSYKNAGGPNNRPIVIYNKFPLDKNNIGGTFSKALYNYGSIFDLTLRFSALYTNPVGVVSEYDSVLSPRFAPSYCSGKLLTLSLYGGANIPSNVTLYPVDIPGAAKFLRFDFVNNKTLYLAVTTPTLNKWVKNAQHENQMFLIRKSYNSFEATENADYNNDDFSQMIANELGLATFRS